MIQADRPPQPMSSLEATGNPIPASHDEPTRMSTIKSSLLTSSSRCTQCTSGRNEKARNLVVCIDGTSNQFGRNNTNVVKLLAKVDLKTTYPKQYTYYSSGIGTRPKTPHIFERIGKVISDKFDEAVAWNVGEIIKDAYRWLAQRYQEGDQIYLFGFSRGAYQVRVLAGMIHDVGLLKTTTERQVGTAYDHYEAIRSRMPMARQNARDFKNTFCWDDVRVHFVGAWDTVSSVGLTRGDVFIPFGEHACHVRHALALDERRVKFMPEYFQKMNPQSDDGKSRDVLGIDEYVPAREPRGVGVSTDETYISEGRKQGATEIKEVWFAGSHSDVGGKNAPGMSYQAGNVSLLWMRREAAAKGLVLQPSDVVWVPDDLDLGTSNSMSRAWKAFEYLPIKHQVTFRGVGEDSRRRHLRKPRLIIPGQKVHTSVLYASAYKPQASLGEGFLIPIAHAALDVKPNKETWETGLFDGTAAEELVARLGDQYEVASIYLDKLLFMLRFEEGKQCVRNVPDWQNRFTTLIESNCEPLVKLVAIIALYEASSNGDTHPESPAPPYIRDPPEFSQDVLSDAKKNLSHLLTTYKHANGPTVFTLLRPLAKYRDLRESILTPDVLETFVESLDGIIREKRRNFGQAVDGLNCLLQCEDTRGIVIEKLGQTLPGSNVLRLRRILEVKDRQLLTAALRMTMTLARISEDTGHSHADPIATHGATTEDTADSENAYSTAKTACSAVKHKIRKLAKEHGRLVGLLAVEILLVLYDEKDREHLDVRNSRIRANICSALVRLHPDRGDSPSPGQHKLRRVFGLDAQEFSEEQKKFREELVKALRRGNARERTAATMALLELCESESIRPYFVEAGLLRVFVEQLRFKKKALLAAYALVKCLKHSDMKESLLKDDELQRNIVGMLRLDYFDDAVGPFEGFQIFTDLMQHADLREKIRKYNITEVLQTKLGKGNSREARTSLICLDIFRSFEGDDYWIRERKLVERSLERLQNPEWDVQKAGVAILSALAQTRYGEEAIKLRICEIIRMLLPRNPGRPRAASCMMGPACALYILVQNGKHYVLRDLTRETVEYTALKNLYLSGMLIDIKDTKPWHIWSPNRTDVINMLDDVIKVVDKELSEIGQTSLGSATLPQIQHWSRLVLLLFDEAVLPVLLGLFSTAGALVGMPIYAFMRTYKELKLLLARRQDVRILDGLREGEQDV